MSDTDQTFDLTAILTAHGEGALAAELCAGEFIAFIDQEDPAFRRDFLRHANYWDAMCMARRSTHLAHPYCTRRIRDGFAFEDWHWNCETIDGGHVHEVVADTAHLKRRRASSQTTQASGNRSLMLLTALTDYGLLTAV